MKKNFEVIDLLSNSNNSPQAKQYIYAFPSEAPDKAAQYILKRKHEYLANKRVFNFKIRETTRGKTNLPKIFIYSRK